MATHFTSSNYRLGSQVKLSTAKKIHPETGGWFLEAYSFSHDEFLCQSDEVNCQSDEFNSQVDKFNSQSDEFNCKSNEFNCENLYEGRIRKDAWILYVIMIILCATHSHYHYKPFPQISSDFLFPQNPKKAYIYIVQI